MIANPVQYASGAKTYQIVAYTGYASMDELSAMLPMTVEAGETVFLQFGGTALDGRIKYTIDGKQYTQKIWNSGMIGANKINFVMPAADVEIF